LQTAKEVLVCTVTAAAENGCFIIFIPVIKRKRYQSITMSLLKKF